MSPELRCLLLESQKAIAEHGEAYDALISRQSGQRPPILRRSWMAGLWPAYVRQGSSLFFIAVMRGQAMVALMPLVCRTAPGRLPLVRKLQFFGQEAGALALVNFCADIPVCPQENPLESMQAIREFLFTRLPDRWDVIELRGFFHDSPCRAAFEQVFCAQAGELSLPGFAADLPAEAESLSACFSKSTTRTLKKRLRRLHESGLHFEFSVFTRMDEDLFGEIASLHSSRQTELAMRGRKGRDSVFDHPSLKAGLLLALVAQADVGALRIYMLRIEGNLAAVQLLFGHGAEACAWLTAMDSRYESFSPSRLLLDEMNRNEILLYGTRAIDHMPGATPFKQEMTNRRYDTMNYEVVNRARAGARVRYAVLAAGRRLRERIRARTRRPLAEGASAPSLQASDA